MCVGGNRQLPAPCPQTPIQPITHLPPTPTPSTVPQVPSIWAIGDCTDRMNLTPVALMEGKALVATLFGGTPTTPDYENVGARLRGAAAVACVACGAVPPRGARQV